MSTWLLKTSLRPSAVPCVPLRWAKSRSWSSAEWRREPQKTQKPALRGTTTTSRGAVPLLLQTTCTED